VITARYAALEPWWHQNTDEDRTRARFCLGELGVGHHADRSFGALSSGEQQRVLLARTTMNDPALILLDEPSARLDLGGREELVAALADIIRRPTGPPIVVLTHHVAEIPQGITHAMLLQCGNILTAGPIDETLTAALLGECFGLPLELERRHDGRFNAWASQ
jgi:iron complex transport system ATP-binding protein